MNKGAEPFWKKKSLKDMTLDEWESLCDGCGKCCLHKLEDDASSIIYYTNVACRLLDIKSCRCNNYKERKRLVPDCTVLKPELVDQFTWLPETCAYRLISEGKDLFDWHPLISGSDQSVHTAKVSVADTAISERHAGDLEDYIIDREGL